MEEVFGKRLIKEIATKYDLNKGKKINSEKLIAIYKDYSNYFNESEFANLLGIKDRGYKKIINNPEKEVFVFMNQQLTEEEKEQELLELANDYKLYKGQKITLSFFEKMYDRVKAFLTEVEFADLLGIKKAAFNMFKLKSKDDPNVTVRILMNNNLSKEEQIKQILELAKTYDLYKGQEIDYNFFIQLYDKFRIKLTEIEFARLLGISQTSLKNIRNRNEKAKLFGNMKLSEEVTESIRKEILKKYEGKTIGYGKDRNNGEVDFKSLQEPYKIYFTENEFAKLFGISEKNLWYTKRRKANPKIKDVEKIEKVEKLKKEIVEGRYYTKEELEEICSTVDLTVNDFITYYINKGNFFDHSEYKNALENNKKLWIGKCNIENSYLEKYNKMLENIVGTVINGINKKYGAYYLEEDIKSDMLIYMINNCGDIILNFEHDLELMERMLWVRVRKYGQIKYLEEIKKDIKKAELIEEKMESKTNFVIDYKDLDIMEDKIDEEYLTEILKIYLDQGYDKETIIEKISKKFSIQKEDILDKVKGYLLEQGKVVQNKKGEYEIGDK